MATAHDYRRVAAQLERFAAALEHWWSDHHRAAAGVAVFGPVRAELDGRLGVTRTDVHRLTDQIRIQIGEAHRRAAVCEQYTRAMHQFWSSDDPAARQPRRPASWVSVG